ncbi:hypothetical protein M404DRAFT_998675 [Pisolithus tinctorius Marx 270]|uniref:Uncharacterized protein n=1 Tax=Pisolithus tinctorius Marx 270 TaxID=870435 RepID=A0A0C3PEC3_PISTI|nr:hypothetical protein M404DRAFT_998675 [Pisolithus tinctorius Marx 270]
MPYTHWSDLGWSPVSKDRSGTLLCTQIETQRMPWDNSLEEDLDIEDAGPTSAER